MKVLNYIAGHKRKLQLGLAVLPMLALLGCPASAPDLTETPKFVAVNFYDSLYENVDMTAGTEGSLVLASNLSYQGIAPMATLDTTRSAMFNLRLTGASGNLVTDSGTVTNYNVTVAYGRPSAAQIRNFNLIQAELPVVTVINVDSRNIQNYDTYVTTPGADITSLSPDARDLPLGFTDTLEEAVHEGANFQVRLCPAGTKTVVATYTAIPSAARGTNYVFFVGSSGTSISQQSTYIQTMPSL